jgi:hypothetical protein
MKSLANGVEHVENRVSGTEDKLEEWDQTVNDHEKMLRKYEWNMQNIWDTIKRSNLWIMGIDKGENKLQELICERRSFSFFMLAVFSMKQYCVIMLLSFWHLTNFHSFTILCIYI